jgi:multiple sugar transport system permease protein
VPLAQVIGRSRNGAEAAARPPRLSYWRRDALSGYLFIAPQLAGFALFVLGPMLAVFFYALHEWNLVFGTFNFVGLRNFEHLLGDRELAPVALNSALFALGYVPLNVGLGLAIAVAVNRATILPGLFRTLYFAPVVVSVVAWTIVWRFLLQGDGAVSGITRSLGLGELNWLREPGPALGWVVLVQVLKTVGLSMVIVLAALQGIPRELEEAARVDGATNATVFRRITFPLITPFVFLVTALSIINSLKTFALIYLLTRGGPGNSTTVLAYYVYEQGFQRFEMGYASTISVVLFGVVLALTVGQFAVRRRWVFQEDEAR